MQQCEISKQNIRIKSAAINKTCSKSTTISQLPQAVIPGSNMKEGHETTLNPWEKPTGTAWKSHGDLSSCFSLHTWQGDLNLDLPALQLGLQHQSVRSPWSVRESLTAPRSLSANLALPNQKCLQDKSEKPINGDNDAYLLCEVLGDLWRESIL